jgi:hypothetical protein
MFPDSPLGWVRLPLPDRTWGRRKLTCWLLPGSLTVANCSSLYFSNEDVSFLTIVGSCAMDLMSAEGGRLSVWDRSVLVPRWFWLTYRRRHLRASHEQVSSGYRGASGSASRTEPARPKSYLARRGALQVLCQYRHAIVRHICVFSSCGC